MRLKLITLLVALAGLGSTAHAQVVAVQELNSAAISANTAATAQGVASIIQQLTAAADTRTKILAEQVKQTAYQLQLLNNSNDWMKEAAAWTTDGALPSNPLASYYEKMQQQAAQQYALTQFADNLADVAGQYYPGMDIDLDGYTPSKHLTTGIQAGASVLDNAKGVLLSSSLTRASVAKSESMAVAVDSVITNKDISSKELLQLLLMIANENMRQMQQFRTEMTNFTSMMANKVAQETQKELTESRIKLAELQDSDSGGTGTPANTGKSALLSEDPSLKTPSQLGWGLQSKYVNY